MTAELQIPVTLAKAMAEIVHEGDLDKGGAPYIGHVERVAACVEGLAPAEIREEAVTAAWLHDTVEDHPDEVDLEALTKLGFKPEVVEAVDALTRREGEPYGTYVDRVTTNLIATWVKYADLLDNTDPERLKWLDEATWERLRGKYEPALERARETLGLDA
jgi:(p)ppGpp synthase/HD superfamily hydrolase